MRGLVRRLVSELVEANPGLFSIGVSGNTKRKGFYNMLGIGADGLGKSAKAGLGECEGNEFS